VSTRGPPSAGRVALQSQADQSDGAKPRGAGFTAEFLLTAACCRWPPSELRTAAVRATAAEIDWDEFLRLVRRQRVIGLAHEALQSAGIDCPAALAKELSQRSQQIVQQNLSLATETVRLQRAFEAAQIPALVLKGVALAQLSYGSLTAKHARDIDFLVTPECAEAGLRLLEREGYALSSPAERLGDAQRRALVHYAREAELVQRDSKILVELQWRAANNPLLLEGVDARSATQSVALSGGVSVHTLAPNDLFAYLCVHGAQHAWSRLKWLADLNALVATNAADIAQLYRHAQSIGASLCAGQALSLCQRVLGLSLPASLADEIQANKRVQRLVAIAMAAMTARQTETEADAGFLGVARSVGTQFLLGQGWRFYAAQCRTASAGTFDIIDLPLPPWLYFLYPILRLPLWLWRRARAAVTRGKAS
jgi:Uncharacterised nucleotidyltransferase